MIIVANQDMVISLFPDDQNKGKSVLKVFINY